MLSERSNQAVSYCTVPACRQPSGADGEVFCGYHLTLWKHDHDIIYPRAIVALNELRAVLWVDKQQPLSEHVANWVEILREELDAWREVHR